VRTVRRRSLVAVASVAAVSLFPATRASSQVFLYKFGWGTLFAGLQVALDAIPYVANWLQGDSAEAKAALCKLTLPDISALEYRCLAVAVALDSNGEGPVIPPERGTIGIIPALADFVASPDHATEGVVLQACFNVLGVAESEVTKDNWFSAIREAGLRAEDVAILSEQLKYSTSYIREFMGFYNPKFHSAKYDITVAKSLSRQLSEMPLAARRAIEATQAIAAKLQHTSCK
jgi:hypothetical protein